MNLLGYDDPWTSPSSHLHGEPVRGGQLSHLVFLDGRLVDTWTEPVEHTRYEGLAREPLPQPRPMMMERPTPRWQHQLEWLDELVGGRPNLLALDDAPLAEEVPDEVPAAVLDVTGRLASRWFVDEIRQAGRNVLGLLWRLNPVLAGDLTPGEQAVISMWLAGRANGVAGAGGITLKTLSETIGLAKAPTAAVNRVRAEIQGICDVAARHEAQPDLLSLRHPELLTSRTRAELVRLRDEALQEAETVSPSTGE